MGSFLCLPLRQNRGTELARCWGPGRGFEVGGVRAWGPGTEPRVQGGRRAAGRRRLCAAWFYSKSLICLPPSNPDHSFHLIFL